MSKLPNDYQAYKPENELWLLAAKIAAKIMCDNNVTKYKHKVYSTGYSIKVTPEDRGVDVLHYLITGGLFCGRSLEGVTWEKIENPHAAKALSRSMQHSQERNV